MRYSTKLLGVLSAVLVCAGCDFLLSLSPATTTVRLVNLSDFPVEVTIFIDDEQDLPEDLLTEVGTEIQFTVAAGDTMTFSRECDAFQVMIVGDADLRIVGGIGPEARSDVLRDGDDFSCGDTITFTFDHSAAILDFDVSTSVQ